MTEQEILKFWQENEIFKKSLEKSATDGEFVFYDGPPFATGTPHYGHILTSVIKDVIPRYQTMKGKRVPRQWGWDCHGLPIENIAEKELGIKRKKEIEEMGIAKFNEFCRSKVLSYTEEWKKVIASLGRWVDMDNAYKTMDLAYMENVWKVFKELWDKGLIYEGYRSMHICTRCETTLSQQEVAEGYKDIKDLSATAKFELIEESKTQNLAPKTYILAWTTTPWTLIGNVALAVGEEIDYIKAKIKNKEDNKEEFIIGEELWWQKFISDDRNIINQFESSKYEILEIKKIKSKDLVGKNYKPLFDYYIGKGLDNEENGWKIYAADFVNIKEGTGIVHIAPAFGEDDLNLGIKEKLPFIQHVGMDGIIKSEAGEFAGMSVKPMDDHQKTDVEIIKYLAKNNLLFAKEKYEHSYPHCWRCDTPLINYATSSWFVSVLKIKDKALELAKEINWSPAHIKEGRFGKWLEGARDWSISRQRYWASAIPIWKCVHANSAPSAKASGNTNAPMRINEGCGAIKVIGSVEELKKNAKKSNNKYFVMRHGQAESNGSNLVSSKIENSGNYPLTEKGKEEIIATIKNLKDKKLDFIFYSEFERTKQTAFLVAEEIGLSANKIIPDKRIREINVGDFEGGSVDNYHKYFNSLEEKFHKNPPGGENLNELKKRMGEFIYDIDRQYENKNILIVSHEYSIWMLFSAVVGFDEKQSVKIKEGNDDFIKTAEIREMNFVPLSHTDNFVLDIHRPYVDEIVLECGKCGGAMKRIPDVLDTWFDSGSMPYTKKEFPAEFIGEGVDQTRAWFYYLHIIAVALENSIAYKNVIVNGIVLAEDGKKMAKRLKNYPDPTEVMEKYGADALRYYLLTSPVVAAENLNFSEKGVDEARKKVIMRLKNVLAFYKMYTEKILDSRFKIQDSKNILDEWILIRLNQLISEVSAALDKYELNTASRPIGDFIDDLSNWYVRRSRERFKEEGEDKENAIATLHHILTELSKIIAPFMPFIAEEIYQELKGGKESVHLEEWPQKDLRFKIQDLRIIEDMNEARKIASIALEERQKAGIKVRQVLNVFYTTMIVENDDILEIVREEINVKEIKTGQKENKLDINITLELKNEGMARELVRAIQDLRKKSGFSPQDKINLMIETDELGEKFIKNFENEIKKGTNSVEIKFVKIEGKETKPRTELDSGALVKINDLNFKIEIQK